MLTYVYFFVKENYEHTVAINVKPSNLFQEYIICTQNAFC